MHNDRAVAEESAGAFEGGDVELEVAVYERRSTSALLANITWEVGSSRCLESGSSSDVPVFARQITRLALLRRCRVARWLFATDGGIEVGQGTGAATVRGNRLVVDVIHCISC